MHSGNKILSPFYKRLLKARLIAILCLIGISGFWNLSSTRAQINHIGLPPITQYPSELYGGGVSAYCAESGPGGIIYFGIENYLVSFDGVQWRKYACPFGEVKNLHYDGTNFYWTSSVHFGKFSIDSLGGLIFKDLSYFIEDSIRKAGSFQVVVSIGDHLVIVASNYVIYLDSKNYQPTQIIYSENVFKHNFESKAGHFIHHDGVVKLIKSEGLLTLFDTDENWKPMRFIGSSTHPVTKDTLLISNNEGIFLLKNKKITYLPCQLSDKIKEVKYFRFVDLGENGFGISSITDGLLLVNDSLSAVQHINAKSGLTNDIIFNMDVDGSNNIWCCGPTGLTKIQPFSSLGNFDDRNGWDGSMPLGFQELKEKKLFINSFNNLYGLDLFNHQATKNLELILKTEQFFSGSFIFNHVAYFYNRENGIFRLKDKKLFHLSNDSITAFKQVNDKLLFGIKNDELFQITIQDDKLTKRLLLKDTLITENSIFRLDQNNCLWIAATKGWCYYSKLDTNSYVLEKPKMLHLLNNNKTLGGAVFENNFLATTSDGILQIADTIDGFKILNVESLSNEERESYLYCHKTKDKLWLYSPKIIFNRFTFIDGTFIGDSINIFAPIQNTIWECFPLSNGDAVFPTASGFIYYNSSIQVPKFKSYTCNFSKIKVISKNSDSLIYAGFDTLKNGQLMQQRNKISKLPYASNSIRFELGFNQYIDEEKTQFSFRLNGFSDDWSVWTKEPFKEITNLYEGHYNLEVRSKNVYGAISNSSSFQFIILPPWYRSIVAYVVYCILLISLIWGIVKLSVYKVQQDKHKLELIVDERTNELRSQRDELAKLSIVASETDNGVAIANAQGRLEWINPGFTKLTGYTFDEYTQLFGKTIFEASTIEELPDLVAKAKESGDSQFYESLSHHKNGDPFWVQSTLTPIFEGEHQLSKLVIIDTDITERKKQEKEIRKLHNNLKGSINYAQRIQEAILPDQNNLKTHFPDSFIYFKPKDVVSGDFAWIYHNSDATYVAAIDCTGHGVPGAMLSMIGHFVLNNIMNAMKMVDPGMILTKLHQEIVAILNQEANKDSRDGMDLALCRIYKRDQIWVMEYAGAHRPLVYFKKGKCLTQKGDRFPVGGTQYSRTGKKIEFQTFSLEEGDAFYIFSDGLQDQIGGPMGRKLGSKNILKLLDEVKDEPMEKQQEALDLLFTSWLGENKQLDDVLVIGIKPY